MNVIIHSLDSSQWQKKEEERNALTRVCRQMGQWRGETWRISIICISRGPTLWHIGSHLAETGSTKQKKLARTSICVRCPGVWTCFWFSSECLKIPFFLAGKWEKKIFITQHFGRLCLSIGAHRYQICMSSRMVFDSKSFRKCHARKAWIAAHIFSRQKFWIHSHVRRADSLFWFWSNMIWLVSHGNDCCFAWHPACAPARSLLFSRLLFVHKMI